MQTFLIKFSVIISPMFSILFRIAGRQKIEEINAEEIDCEKFSKFDFDDFKKLFSGVPNRKKSASAVFSGSPRRVDCTI